VASERPERELARELYTSGMTYPEIVAKLGVAKSTVSKWCNDLAAARQAAKIVKTVVREKKAKRERVIKAEKTKRERKGIDAAVPYEGFTLYLYPDRSFSGVQLVRRATQENFNLTRARYNMAVHLGRRLEKHELVRHISSDVTDDSISNLKILIKGSSRDFKPVFRACKSCEKEFQATRASRRYCSDECRARPVSKVPQIRQPVRATKIQLPTLVESECVICETKFRGREGIDVCSNKCRGTLIRLLAQEAAR